MQKINDSTCPTSFLAICNEQLNNILNPNFNSMLLWAWSIPLVFFLSFFLSFLLSMLSFPFFLSFWQFFHSFGLSFLSLGESFLSSCDSSCGWYCIKNLEEEAFLVSLWKKRSLTYVSPTWHLTPMWYATFVKLLLSSFFLLPNAH